MQRLLDINKQYFLAPLVVRAIWYIPPYHAKLSQMLIGLISSGAKTGSKQNKLQTSTKVPFARREQMQRNYYAV